MKVDEKDSKETDRGKTELGSRSRGNIRVIFKRIGGTVRGNFYVETFSRWGTIG